MTKVSSLDLKKGARVRLRNGWEADVLDNTVKQHTRVCKVYGWETECGSVYTTDIEAVLIDGRWLPVEFTPGQEKARLERVRLGF